MRITKSKLEQLIKEELRNALLEVGNGEFDSDDNSPSSRESRRTAAAFDRKAAQRGSRQERDEGRGWDADLREWTYQNKSLPVNFKKMLREVKSLRKLDPLGKDRNRGFEREEFRNIFMVKRAVDNLMIIINELLP
jgi:hypothetical protein